MHYFAEAEPRPAGGTAGIAGLATCSTAGESLRADKILRCCSTPPTILRIDSDADHSRFGGLVRTGWQNRCGSLCTGSEKVNPGLPWRHLSGAGQRNIARHLRRRSNDEVLRDRRRRRPAARSLCRRGGARTGRLRVWCFRKDDKLFALSWAAPKTAGDRLPLDSVFDSGGQNARRLPGRGGRCRQTSQAACVRCTDRLAGQFARSRPRRGAGRVRRGNRRICR